jgi:hypothetical protein
MAMAICVAIVGTASGQFSFFGNRSAHVVSIKAPETYRDPVLLQLARTYNDDLLKLADEMNAIRYVNTDGETKQDAYIPQALSFKSIVGGRYLCLQGESQSMYFGWKNDKRYRAGDIFGSIVQSLLLPQVGKHLSIATNITGYMFTITTQVYPFKQEFKDEFMSQKLAKFGAKQVRATKGAGRVVS